MKKLITKYPNPTINNLFIKMAPECEKVNMYFNKLQKFYYLVDNLQLTPYV